LKERKRKIQEELVELNHKYSELGFGAKISGQIASVVKSSSSMKNLSGIAKTKKFFAKNVMGKISKKFGQAQSMKEALENLSNINTSVDELIKMQAPYGEMVERYEKLTAYLNQANVIHSKITRNVEAITKKKV
jgi:hypothetical protein